MSGTVRERCTETPRTARQVEVELLHRDNLRVAASSLGKNMSRWDAKKKPCPTLVPRTAPPLMPKVGPWLGWRRHVTTLRPRCAPSACDKPTVVVLFPSPSGVGVIPPTTTAARGRL